MSACSTVPLVDLLTQDTTYINQLEPRLYPKLSVKLYGRGVVLDRPMHGADVRMTKHQLAKPGQVILSEIWAKKGAIGIVPNEGAGALCTSHFFLFDIDKKKAFPEFLEWLLRGNYLEPQLSAEARGTTGYAAIRPKQFLAKTIPLPSLAEQQAMVARLDALFDKTRQLTAHLDAIEADANALVRSFLFGEAAHEYPRRKMSELVQLQSPDVVVDRSVRYQFAGVYSFGRGVFASVNKTGSDFAYERLSTVREGDFIYPKLMAWEGSLGVVPQECDGRVVSPEFPVFSVDTEAVLPEVLDIYFRTPSVWPELAALSGGTNVRRRRLQPSAFLAYEMPIPPMPTQRRIRDLYRHTQALKARHMAIRESNAALLPATLERLFSSEARSS